MITKIKNNLTKLTKENPDKEICGIFYVNYDTFNYFNCKNISTTPHNSFEIGAEDFIKAENSGDVVGVFHSHINETSEFSENDKNLAHQLGLPIFCYSEFDKKMREYRPDNYTCNLYQRQFIRGYYDCYSLIRDYYWNNFKFLLDDFDRDNDFEDGKTSIMQDNFALQGFYIPENQIDLKEHDLILYKSIQNPYPQHLEVFIGDSKVAQHLLNRLSGKDYIREGLLKKRTKILRFKDLTLKNNTSFA